MKMKDLEWWHWVIIGLVILGIVYLYSNGQIPIQECQTNQNCMNKYQSCFSVCSDGKCYYTGLNECPNLYWQNYPVCSCSQLTTTTTTIGYVVPPMECTVNSDCVQRFYYLGVVCPMVIGKDTPICDQGICICGPDPGGYCTPGDYQVLGECKNLGDYQKFVICDANGVWQTTTKPCP